jgi:Helix-turn-helix of DDE superfamily endonuclease
MFLYTSLQYDAFAVLLSRLQRFSLTYYRGWTPTSLSLDNQLLLTLIKLKMNCEDADFAFRFDCSLTTVSNIFYTLVGALHELLNNGRPISSCSFSSQLKCKGSMPKAFDGFGSARVFIDDLEIEQDIPIDLSNRSRAHNSYESEQTVKAATAVARKLC